jgi:hypothetical protein
MIIDKEINNLDATLKKYSIGHIPKFAVPYKTRGIITLNPKTGFVIDWGEVKQTSLEYIADIFDRQLSNLEWTELVEFVSYRVLFAGNEFGDFLDECREKYGIAIPVNACWNIADFQIESFVNDKVSCLNITFRNSDTLSKFPFSLQLVFNLTDIIADDFKDNLKKIILENILGKVEIYF